MDSSGVTSWSDFVALGSSEASSTATLLRRSVRPRGARCRVGERRQGVVERPEPANSSPVTAWEIPSEARSMPEPALFMPPSMRSSIVMSRSSRSARSLTASSAVSVVAGKPQERAGQTDHGDDHGRGSTPRLWGAGAPNVQYAGGGVTPPGGPAATGMRPAGNVTATRRGPWSTGSGLGREIGLDGPAQLLEDLLTGPQLRGLVGPAVESGEVLGSSPACGG